MAYDTTVNARGNIKQLCKLHLGAIVRIDWQDSGTFGAGTWVDPHDIDDLTIPCVTVGVVARLTADHVAVTSTVQGEDCNGIFVIPKVLVAKVKVLK